MTDNDKLDYVSDLLQEVWERGRTGKADIHDIEEKLVNSHFRSLARAVAEAEMKAQSERLMFMSALLRSVQSGKIMIDRRYFAEANHKDIICNYTSPESNAEVFYIEKAELTKKKGES